MGNPCLGCSRPAHHPLSITPGGIPVVVPVVSNHDNSPAGKTAGRREMFGSKKEYFFFYIFFLISAAANQLRHHPAAALWELLLEIPGRGEERRDSCWEFSPASPSWEGGRRAGKVRLL